MIFKTSKRADGHNTSFPDSANSFVQISADTLKLFLKSGRFGESYWASFIVLPDTAYSTFESTDHHPRHNYVSSTCSILLKKKTYRPGEYLTVQIYYKTIGTPDRHNDNDTVVAKGKIKLKIRDSKFDYYALFVEDNRNQFYS